MEKQPVLTNRFSPVTEEEKKKEIKVGKFCLECLESMKTSVSKRCVCCHHYLDCHICPFKNHHNCPSLGCDSIENCPTNATQSHRRKLCKKRDQEIILEKEEKKKMKFSNVDDEGETEEEIIAHIKQLENRINECKKRLALLRFSQLSPEKMLELSQL